MDIQSEKDLYCLEVDIAFYGQKLKHIRKD